MTNLPEARLALEAEIAYATLALVTDHDSWREREAAVTANTAMANLMENAAQAQGLVREVVLQLQRTPPISAAHQALSNALITPVSAMDTATRQRLQPLLSRWTVAPKPT
jgi:5'-methylthioadenosine phosphorylase